MSFNHIKLVLPLAKMIKSPSTQKKYIYELPGAGELPLPAQPQPTKKPDKWDFTNEGLPTGGRENLSDGELDEFDDKNDDGSQG